jgi:hypothetical protein
MVETCSETFSFAVAKDEGQGRQLEWGTGGRASENVFGLENDMACKDPNFKVHATLADKEWRPLWHSGREARTLSLAPTSAPLLTRCSAATRYLPYAA